MRYFTTCLLLVAITAITSAEDVSFNRDIRPILSENCYYCHGFDDQHREADLRLDTEDGSLQAIEPGSPADSELLRRIMSTDGDEVMPPPSSHKKPLSPAQIELISRWIEQGAKYEGHWAFIAPVRTQIPSDTIADGQNPIDYFVGKKLRDKSLEFSPAAEPGKLLRRATLDLTGVPPTMDELNRFISQPDGANDEYEAVIDRLLASRRYGERMAMDWLDAARYADTNGYQGDAYRMNWPWRDWVVNAFNDNMPFDQFTIEQLAGDLLEDPTEKQLIATAFNRNHMLNAEGGTIPEENRTKNVFDRVETTSGVWLGLTFQCCQCHDHKFDPLKQSDYYSMYALFNQVGEPGGVDKRFGKKDYSDEYDKLYAIESPYISIATREQADALKNATAARKQAEKNFSDRKSEYFPAFAAWVEEMRTNTTLIEQRIQDELDRRAVTSAKLDSLFDGNTQRLLNIYFRLEGNEPYAELMSAIASAKRTEDDVQATIPLVMVMRDDKPRETRILERGNYETPGAVVPPGIPSFLPALPEDAKVDRLALAKWLVSDEQPLMSRVVINRLWQLFFGQGLVKTPEDFGMQGALPSHPELLDWLAVEFRESGWDVKRMVKLILTSRTYQQSANVTPALLAIDPDNALLARGPRQRIDSRFLRDQALSLSGLLIDKPGGFAVMPYQPPGIWEDMSFDKNRYFEGTGEDLYRRSLYTFWRRSVAPANFFDVPARQVCALKPQRTNTPLHALTTLNDVTYVEAARVWAAKLMLIEDECERIEQAFLSATGANPDENVLKSLKNTLAKARMHFAAHRSEAEKLTAAGESPPSSNTDPVDHAAWTTLCLLILNLDETLTK